MHQHVPQSAPPGTRKGGPNPSKIMKKSSLSRPGCLQVTFGGPWQPKSPKWPPKLPKNNVFLSKFRQSTHSCSYYKIQKKMGSVPPCISMFVGTIFAGRVLAWFIAFLTDWWIDWFIDFFIYWFMDLLIYRFIDLFVF